MLLPDHIVIVVEENHDADQVLGNPNAPYINGTLVANGVVYTNAHGTDHPSQPNYLELFAGANPGVQGVNSPLQQHYPMGMENTPAGQNALVHGDDYNAQPFSVPNLGAELMAAGRTFAGYSEDLPSVGFTGVQANGIQGSASYVEKHNPWAQFEGSGPNQLPRSTNQPFATFQSLGGNFAALPTISFVVPNQYNDMHNTVSSAGLPAVNGTGVDSHGNPVNGASTIENGDTWLANNIEPYRRWATTHNSLLITVWDENDDDFSDANNIPMIIDGDPSLFERGVNSFFVNHFDLLRTLEHSYGLDATGAAATANGLTVNSDGKLLTDKGLFGSTTNDPNSPGGIVYGLYDGLLGRMPDQLGLENWTAALESGIALREITRDFLASDEFTHDFGPYLQLSDPSFIQDLYHTALRRPAETGGLQHYENLLANGFAREDVALDILLSEEHEQDLQAAFSAGVFVPSLTDTNIARLYYGLLNRAPDSPGLQNWDGAAANGLSLETIAQDFINSSEYQSLHGTETDQQFVDTLYQNGLGRAPDAPGEQHYETLLSHGVPRADVALFITGSPEAQVHLEPVIEYGFRLA